MTPETIGHYRVTARIGAGGMGEVYRAHDPKLGRDVAIKVLPPLFAEDAGRMARFEREARVLASLNHPNIAQIYGVEEHALVMELVEGGSLKGPMPFDDAWKIAMQIAGALEYAHDKGVVHRDLKPANVKVTPDGVVKLLDFGLAKAYSDQPDAASGDPSLSPTVTLGATVAGTIMGTAAYMSPEQARGKPVDKRADIWSWGVVLYELLTGEQLFRGEDAAETLAAVIHKQPDVERAPLPVRTLLLRCLEKDPKKRLRDIGVAKELLEQEPRAAAPLQSRFRVGGWIASMVLAVALAAVSWIAWRATRPVAQSLVRLDVDLGADVALASTNSSFISLSPNGKRVVYLASLGGGAPRLFVRRLDQPNATELSGTEGAIRPFFSPDGQWIGFAAGGKLNKISVEGGAVVPLGSVGVFGGASWGEDNNIVFTEPIGRGLLQVPAGGGEPTVLEKRNAAGAPIGPQILPGGKAILLTEIAGRSVDTYTIEVFTFADRHLKSIRRGGTAARYLPVSAHAGYLVYTNNATLFAVRFDPDKLEMRGNPVPVLDDVAFKANGEFGQFTYSSSGTLVYRKGSAATGPAMSTIQWVDSAGKRQPLLSEPKVYQNLAFSPDGKRLAVAEGTSADIWVYDLQRGSPIRLTFGEAANAVPVWSLDGKYIVFPSARNGLWWTRGDGAGQPQLLIQSNFLQIPWSFTPDGKRLAYIDTRDGSTQIWTVPVEENVQGLKAGMPEPFFKSQSFIAFPSLSPDGRWFAYSTNTPAGDIEVFVRSFPPPASGQGGQWQVSTGRNSGPTPLEWSPIELYYQKGDQIMATRYSVEGDAFHPQQTRTWIPKVGGTPWALAPNAKRVAVITPIRSGEAPQQEHTVVFLQNFLDYLKQKVPLP